jgi:hypothetical protein
VYLLGATLHEIITGEPPHGGDDLATILTHAFASEPKRHPEHVPEELAAIADKAMARFNEDRFESAAAFAQAIDEFLEHRSSILLCDAAERRLEALREAIGEAAELDDATSRAIHMIFSECRFGFQQALRGWEGNRAARQGLRAALGLMIEHELDRGAAEAAAALLHELDEAPPRLRKRVERALAGQREADARLRRLERDADLSFGERLRRSLTYSLGATWCLMILASGVGPKLGLFAMNHDRFALACGLFGVTALVIAGATRETMLANATNRRLSLFTITVFFTQAILWWMLGQLGLSLPDANIVATFASGTLWIAAAFTIDASWGALALANAVAVIGVAAFPAWHFEITGTLSGMASLTIPTLKRRRLRAAHPQESLPPPSS